MAQQKQAKRRRNATSARKKAPHGGSQSRRPVNVADPVTAPANGFKSRVSPAKATVGDQPDDADFYDVAPVRTGPLGWVRANPLKFTTWLLALFGSGCRSTRLLHYETHSDRLLRDRAGQLREGHHELRVLVPRQFPPRSPCWAWPFTTFLAGSTADGPVGLASQAARFAWPGWAR